MMFSIHRGTATAAVLAIALLTTMFTRGATVDSLTYAWVDLSACASPKIAPPHLPAATDLVYNVQRRFLDLDRNGRCVVMDVWLERMASMPDSVSRNLVRRLYRFDGKRWAEFIVPELTYYPYALQSSDGKTVFVLAPVDEDVGDPVVLAGAPPSCYQAPSGQKGLFGADGTSLTSCIGDFRTVLRSLAQRLSERLTAGQLFNEELLTVAPAIRPRIEQQRIEMLSLAAR